jgi:hypothetical protein
MEGKWACINWIYHGLMGWLYLNHQVSSKAMLPAQVLHAPKY